MAAGVTALGRAVGWWQVPPSSTPDFLKYLGFAVSCTPIYLVTWRVARRFGWRGLAVFVIAAAIIGPPRDYLFAARYPEWIVFAPGVAPVLAVAATYVSIVVLGHGLMRLVSGPAREDRLARRPWEAA